MDIYTLLELTDQLVVSQTGKHLSDLQRLLLQELWLKPSLRYDELAQTNGYSVSYLKQDIGPKLWQLLSVACGEKVTKTNFRATLKRILETLPQNSNLNSQENISATSQILDIPQITSKVVPSSPRLPLHTFCDRYQDWGSAPDVSVFYNRHDEIAQLKQWVIEDRCRVVVITGMGGMGKTYLSVKLAEQVQDQFEYIIWRSLRNAPSLQQLLTSCLQFLVGTDATDTAATVEEKISHLIQFFRNHRCLLVIDNIETLLQGGIYTGSYEKGHENYGEFFKILGECRHQSCLMMTTREKPKEIGVMQGETLPVRCLHLHGVSASAGLQILQLKGCSWQSEQDGLNLVEQYSGNPLALKIVGATIQELFVGNVSQFFEHNSLVLDQIKALLDQQFNRLTDLSKQILFWIALNQEPISTDELYDNFYPEIPKHKLIECLKSLVQRSILETQEGLFYLQPVVMEYVIHSLIEKVCAEITTGEISILNRYGLLKTKAKEYIRQNQIQFIISPILKQLLSIFQTQENLIQQFQKLIQTLQSQSPPQPGYAAGNIINLLCQLQIDLEGYDFSRLTIWQAYLQDAKLHNVNFQGSDLTQSTFATQMTDILSITFSPDGQFLATADTNGEVRLWSTQDGTLLKIYKRHAGWVYGLDFSPDGRFLCSGSSDQTVKIWDVKTEKCLKTLSIHNQRVRTVAFSPNGKTLASGSSDCNIQLWDIEQGYQPSQTLVGHTSYVWSVSFSPDGKLLASGSEDRTIKIWEVTTGKCLETLQGHTSWVRTVTFSPDGSLLASGSGDHTIKLWDVHERKLRKTLIGHTQRLRSVVFNAEGTLLASGAGDHTAKLWNVATGDCLKTLHGHSSRVSSVAFSPDGSILASSGEDRSVKLWEVQTGNCLRNWQGYASWFQSVAFSPDGTTIASGGEDCMIRLWKLNSDCVSLTSSRVESKNDSENAKDITNCPPENLMTLKGHKGWVCSVVFSSDGLMLASASSDYTIKLWNIRTGQILRTLVGHTRWIRSVALSRNNQILASASGDKTVKLWEIASGKCLATLVGHTGWLWSVVFSPNGQTVASTSEDKTVKLWCVTTGKCLRTFKGHSSWVQAVAFSPDGKLLVSGSCDQTVKLWDVKTGKCLETFWGHGSWIQTVAFSPDGKLLASGSCDQTIRFWDIGQKICWRTLSAHNNWVWSIAFSPDGKLLVSAGQDETVKLWAVATGECLEVLRSKRPYEGMCLADTRNLTQAQLMALKALGAVDEVNLSQPSPYPTFRRLN